MANTRTLYTRAAALMAVVAVLAVLAFVYWRAPDLHESLLFRRGPMQDYGYSVPRGLVVSLLLYAVSLLLSACFLALVPQRRTWFTALGAATLYGYLLHGFVLRGALERGWFAHDWIYTPAGEVTLSIALPYIAYIVSDHVLHLSGVVATAAAGLFQSDQ